MIELNMSANCADKISTLTAAISRIFEQENFKKIPIKEGNIMFVRLLTLSNFYALFVPVYV